MFSPGLKAVIAQAAIAVGGRSAPAAPVAVTADAMTIGDAVRIEPRPDGLRITRITVPLAAQAPEVMVWMREPFLSECDAVDCGRFIVHGHTPLPAGIPDLRRRRVNLDTAAVMGGPLTAAVFDDTQAPPLAFLTDRGGARGSSAETMGEGSERR